MKKLALVCLLALGTTAFAQDLLTASQGKWKVDMAATKKLPENKAIFAKESKDEIGAKMLELLGMAEFVFAKDGLSINTVIEGEVLGSEKLTVVTKKKDLIVLKDKEGEKSQASQKGKTIVLKAMGKAAQDVPTLILVKTK